MYLDRVQTECSCIPWALQAYQVTMRPIKEKSIPVCQDFAFCGLEKETCVAKQTLKDTKCLVPCDGLYADIADNYDTTIQNMKKGAQSFATSYCSKSTGFQMISQEWGTKHVENCQILQYGLDTRVDKY